MKRKIALEVISSAFVILFVYAAMNKLLDYDLFLYQLGRSPYLTHMAGFVAWSIPSFELGIALLLVFEKTRLAGLYASFFMMFLFSAYIYGLLHFSDYIPCSCGGVLASMSWSQHLVFNLCFTALAGLGIYLATRKREPLQVLTQ